MKEEKMDTMRDGSRINHLCTTNSRANVCGNVVGNVVGYYNSHIMHLMNQWKNVESIDAQELKKHELWSKKTGIRVIKDESMETLAPPCKVIRELFSMNYGMFDVRCMGHTKLENMSLLIWEIGLLYARWSTIQRGGSYSKIV